MILLSLVCSKAFSKILFSIQKGKGKEEGNRGVSSKMKRDLGKGFTYKQGQGQATRDKGGGGNLLFSLLPSPSFLPLVFPAFLPLPFPFWKITRMHR